MKKMKNEKGFTLIELLVTITLLALILLMVFPSINRLRAENEKSTYELYGKSMIEAAKLYVTKEGEDLTPLGTKDWVGTVTISLNDLIEDDLIDAFEEDGVVCDNGMVLYQKTTSGEKYSYNLTCTQDGEVVYEERNIEEGLEGSNSQTPTETSTYRVDTKKVTGGTIVSAERFADLGDTITFEPIAESVFQYLGSDIKDLEGNTLLSLDSTTTSFTMPEANVIISPKWKYPDKVVMALDESHDTTWTSPKTSGAAMNSSWQSDRHYWGFSIGSTGNSRIDIWTSKNYDLTHYETYQVKAYEADYPNSGYSVDTYHITMQTAVANTNTSWVHECSNRTSVNGAGNMRWVDINLDISSLTGPYFLGFQILSNSHPFQCNFCYATLIGKTYQ